ncbi:MAG: cysteine desulfurase [Nanoarchaeota archaeon]|nr:cysteine desulfurase [Nanoarchaeota archaeon]
MKIYLDNGATTKVVPEVVRAMKPYFLNKYGNASSIHGFGREAKKALDDSRKKIAKKLNAHFEEIVFTSGGSESNNLAIKGIVHTSEGNHIITSKIEHPSVLETCKELEKQDFKVDYLDVDKDGFVNLEQLKELINKKTILVSIIHGNNEIGVIQDIKKIGDICKENNVLFHTDAVQSFTKFPINVKNMNIDLLSVSSHKIHGPKGVGALFVRKNVKLKKLIEGGHHEFNLRAGTENIHGVVGFARACELIKDSDIKSMERLRNYLIKELLKIKNTRLNGSLEKRLCNNVNISFEFVEGESLLLHLDNKGIAVSTGSACTSQSLESSHVLMAIGLPHEIAHGSIRFTLSKFTKKEELDYTIANVKKIVKNLRMISPLK